MGTNFYLSNGKHIGKRSAAGMYCWDCKRTLCELGEKEIHTGRCKKPNHGLYCNCGWYKECPICGKKPVQENLNDSSSGRELGFNKNPPKKKTGVSSCSSFTWATWPTEIIKYCAKHKWSFERKLIRNEYGDKFTHKEFLQMLEECPVQYFDSIGQCFS